MSKVLVTGGRVIDPSQNMDCVTSILISDGRIESFGENPQDVDRVIDASGLIVAPGLIDMHVELHEPGFEEDETIATGAAAALAGGFTSIACIPYTDPPLDTQASVDFVRQQAAREKACNVFVIACVSQHRKGEQLAEIGSLAAAGAVAFSDAMDPIDNPDLMRRALQYCSMFDKPVLNHPESRDLTKNGLMHEGRTSMVLALPGMPAEAEDVMTNRDLRLAESTGGRLHLLNISTAGSVEQIRRAKKRGVRVTAEVCPHHIALSDEMLLSFDTNCKVNPPLRSQKHIDACIQGLQDGTIDAIASGHAPRSAEKKMQELDSAPFGMVGLETSLGLVVRHLVEPGLLDWPQVVTLMSTNPAKILGLEKGTLQIGADADLTIIDPDVEWVVDPDTFRSKSRNTPLAGQTLRGRATTVIVGGDVRFEG